MRKYHEHSHLVSLLFAETFLLTIIVSKDFLIVPLIFLDIRWCMVDVSNITRGCHNLVVLLRKAGGRFICAGEAHIRDDVLIRCFPGWGVPSFLGWLVW